MLVNASLKTNLKSYSFPSSKVPICDANVRRPTIGKMPRCHIKGLRDKKDLNMDARTWDDSHRHLDIFTNMISS